VAALAAAFALFARAVTSAHLPPALEVRMRIRPLALLILCFGAPSARSWAQTAAGFALDRFSPSGGASDWFALESLDFSGHLRPSGGVTLDWADHPLAVRDNDGHEFGNSIVATQVVAHAGVSMMLLDRLRVGVSMPVAVHQNGNPQVVGDFFFRAPAGPALGDIRLAGDIYLPRARWRYLRLAGGLELLFPTGLRTRYTSDGVVRVAPRLLGAGQVRNYVYAFKLAFQTRGSIPDEQKYALPLGHEMAAGVALGVRPSDELVVGAELYGNTVVTGGNYLRDAVTPLELVFSARFRPTRTLHLMLGVAPGITGAIGSPTMRLLARVEYIPPPPAPDPRSLP
jgi:hypothetical protein